MGLKTFKEHYKIEQFVIVRDSNSPAGKCICIGTPFNSEIITISIHLSKIAKPHHCEKFSSNKDLAKLIEQLREDESNGTLKRLIETPDVFACSLPIFTIKDWAVVTDYCEEYGWPNTTHRGCMMYDNTYFRTREKAYKYLLQCSASNVRSAKRIFKEALIESLHRIKKCFSLLFCDSWFWLVARTVGRFVVINRKE